MNSPDRNVPHTAEAEPLAARLRELERKELDLARRERVMNVSQQLAHLGTWHWDPETGINVWSDEQYRIFGRDPRNFSPTYDAFMAAVHPDDRDKVLAFVKDVLAGERSFIALEHRIVRPDGSVRYVRANAELIRDASGRILELIGTDLDITEQRTIEDAVRASNERLGYVLDATGDAVWDCDFTTGIVNHNRRWCELLGYSDDHLQHPVQFFFDLIHPDDQRRVHARVEESIRTDGEYQIEFRLRRADGGHIWVSDRGRIVARDAAGRPRRMVGALSDITERRIAEDKLRLQTDALAQMAEGISVVDDTGHFVYTNANFDAMFGYAAGELLGQHASICNAPSARDPVETAATILKTLAQRGIWRGEMLNRRKDGSEFWTYSTVKGFRHTAYGEVWLGVQTDITETRRLRHERDNAYLNLEYLTAHMQEETEDLRRELAREIHDEFGATLTGIRMQLEAMAASPLAAPGNQLDEIVERVSEAVKRSRSICTRLRPPMLDDLDLAETVRWCAGDWSHQCGIRATCRLSPLAHEPGNALRTDLFRVLQELLTNVARHSGATRVTITLGSDGRALRLRVRDNGRGFAADDASGFGLIGMRERLRRHGGRLVISSSVRGTAITAEIPGAG